MTVEGASGELRLVYQTAVQLGRWIIEPSGFKRVTLRAAVIHVHALWGHQKPLDLSLAIGTTEWLWEAVEPVYDGSEVVVDLTTQPRVIQHAAPMRGK
jgi:hypothetical protein